MLEGSKRKWWSDKWECSCFNLLWQSCPGPQSKLSQQRRTLCQVIYPLLKLGELFFPSQPWDWLNSSTLLMSRSSRECSHKTARCWKTWSHPNQNLFSRNGLVASHCQTHRGGWKTGRRKDWEGGKVWTNQKMLLEHSLEPSLSVQKSFRCSLIPIWNG